MDSRKKICVFLSSREVSPEDCEATYNFGVLLSKNGFDLVFGGAGVPGMMRELARGIHEHGGDSTSIIPTCFDWGTTDGEPGTAIETADMAERKRTMMEMSGAFVVLKGGLGTLDELLEVWTIKALDGHKKPILIYATPAYKAALIQLFQVMVEEKTVDQDQWEALEWCHSYDDIIQSLKSTFS